MQALTNRQLEILHYVKAGYMGQGIAHALNIKYATVKFHRSEIMRNLDAATLPHAVSIAYEHRIFEVNDSWEHCGKKMLDRYCSICGIDRNRVPGAETISAKVEALARQVKRAA